MSFQLRATLALFCVALVVAAVVPASAEPIREGSYAARRNLIFDGEGGQDLELLIEEPEQGELDGSLDSLLLIAVKRGWFMEKTATSKYFSPFSIIIISTERPSRSRTRDELT